MPATWTWNRLENFEVYLDLDLLVQTCEGLGLGLEGW
jgi:hypothetical protein